MNGNLYLPITGILVVRVYLGDQLVDERRTKNFLTEVGEAYIADRLSDRNQADGEIDGWAIGTGTGRDRTATTLVAEVGTRVAASVAQGTSGDDNDVIWTSTFGTLNPGTDQTITETALFSNATSGGTMINYMELTPGVFKSTTMTLTFTLTWTIGAS